MAGFRDALAVTLELEGGMVDHPHDTGGRTKWGITTARYHRWLRDQGLPILPVDAMTPGQRDVIYGEEWRIARGDDLPWPVAALHFDAVVHHGPNLAGRLLQRAVGATEDGIVGPRTMAAVNRMGPDRTASLMLLHRTLELWRQTLERSGQGVFARGWRNRVLHLGRQYLTP